MSSGISTFAGCSRALLLAGSIAACSPESAPMSAPERASPGGPQAVEENFDATAAFGALSATEDVSAEDWLALAERAREADDFATAERALDLAATSLSPVRVGLERARLLAASGQAEAAVDELTALSEAGFTGVRLITSDPVLGAMAGAGRFDQLVETMSRAAFPCLYDDDFRAFDFWVGEWDVHQPNGRFAGRNSIRREESGCLLTEHWVGATGGTGSSVNFLDKASDEWVQVWNSAGGAQINIRGGLTDEGMELTGYIHYVGNGTTAPFRGLWTPMEDGRVRQYFEQSNDGGETWAPWFEGFYTRRSESETE